MKYLLDTCVLSAFLKKQSNEKVIKWFDHQLEESLFVSVLTIGEIRKGVTRLPDSKPKAELAVWLNGVIRRYNGRLLPIGIETANVWADLKAMLELKGRLIPVIDSLLAATALEHDLALVTRNEDDFASTGVKILNIWS
jgi:tRNA(fMet)-specific endonuclease VapC